jgi:hypothetical protein
VIVQTKDFAPGKQGFIVFGLGCSAALAVDIEDGPAFGCVLHVFAFFRLIFNA